jgi:hypothetical protein
MEQLANPSPGGPPPTALSPEEKRKQVERILESPTFQNARTLQKFLRYISLKAIDGLEEEVKEYTVGVHVFHKGSDFDQRTDTQVRTEASRLRLRLERYYAAEGVSDDVLVELPRGHYIPKFSRRTAARGLDPGSDAGESPVKEGVEPAVVARRLYPRFRAGILVGVVALTAFWAGRSFRPSGPGPVNRSSPESPERTLLNALWSGFVETGNPPLVAFSNPAFLVSDQGEFTLYTEAGTIPVGTLMPPRVPGGPGGASLSFFDAYTGVGEVSAVLNVDRVLRLLGSPSEVKRGRLVTTDDLHRRNTIFVGSPEVNGVLENLRLSREFAFAPQPGRRFWSEHIVNLHPKPGEKNEYRMERDPATGALLTDYGVVSFLPGIGPRRTIAMLAGNLDGGTAAAAEFVTSAAGIQDLINHLGQPDPKTRRRLPPYFEAVVRVEYARGMTVGIHYVAGRTIPAQRSAFLVGASGSSADDNLK